MALNRCMACGSSDLVEPFEFDGLECAACKAKHFADLNDGLWHCSPAPSASTQRAAEAAQATVRDEFTE